MLLFAFASNGTYKPFTPTHVYDILPEDFPTFREANNGIEWGIGNGFNCYIAEEDHQYMALDRYIQFHKGTDKIAQLSLDNAIQATNQEQLSEFTQDELTQVIGGDVSSANVVGYCPDESGKKSVIP